MTLYLRRVALAAAVTLSLLTTLGAAQAAGAFAIGACGAYGYGFDFRQLSDARTAAMKKCAGSDCKLVGDLRRGCAAVAIDAKNPCGSYGWAFNSHLGRAENMSMRRCIEFGGRECVVRAWACDEKG